MIVFFLIVFASLALQSQSYTPTFQDWTFYKIKYNKRYATIEEDLKHRNIFFQRFNEIQEHNKGFEAGNHTYKMEINKFTDQTEEELVPITAGLRGTPPAFSKGISFFNSSIFARAIAPSSFDWRSRGVITPVKNQGACGSCWAFSTLGALEAHLRIYKKQSLSLSEQNLVDCSVGNFGCNGGWVDKAYNYIKSGIASSSSYPYTGRKGACRNTPKVAKVRGYGAVRPNRENEMKEALFNRGPLAVYVNAEGFAQYSKGVYYNTRCSTRTNHAVVIVGYGTENGIDYWLVKNSWGANWGEKGYIKIARNKNNHCGIASYVYFPLL